MTDQGSGDFVRLFTDGACSGNPGPGGWAFILKHPATGKVKDVAGAERLTTNNRMELLAVIRGLETLRRPCRVEVVTDSQYVAQGIAEWLPKWKANGWMRREGSQLKPLKNDDLWKRIDAQLAASQRFRHSCPRPSRPSRERSLRSHGRRRLSRPRQRRSARRSRLNERDDPLRMYSVHQSPKCVNRSNGKIFARAGLFSQYVVYFPIEGPFSLFCSLTIRMKSIPA